VKRPQRKTQIVLFLLAAAALALALYGIHASEPALRTYFVNRMGPHATREKEAEAQAAFEAVLN
jgi:hypothetical protein